MKRTPLAKYLDRPGPISRQLAAKVGITRQAIEGYVARGHRVTVCEDGERVWLERRINKVQMIGRDAPGGDL